MIALAILVRKLPGGMGRALDEGRRKHTSFTCSISHFRLTQPFTFWAGLLGGMVLNTATHGADQMMVQRVPFRPLPRRRRWRLIASGFVILAQFALFLFIGVSLWVFYQDYIPRVRSGTMLRPDEVFAYFIVHYLPTGILGLVVAAIFSAAMSTLSGSLNASASTTVNDLYRPLFPATDERQLMRLSRVLTAGWGLLQMAVALARRGSRGAWSPTRWRSLRSRPGLCSDCSCSVS